MALKECPCGSKEQPWVEYDGYGIPLGYMCNACYETKMKKYRPDINTRYETEDRIEPEDY